MATFYDLWKQHCDGGFPQTQEEADKIAKYLGIEAPKIEVPKPKSPRRVFGGGERNPWDFLDGPERRRR